MKRLQIVSRVMSIFFALSMMAAPIIAALFWMYMDKFPSHIIINNLPPLDVSHIALSLPVSVKLLAIVVTMVPTLVVMYMFYNLSRIFAQYAKNEIFTRENTGRYQRLGSALIVWVIAGWFYDIFISLVFALVVPPKASYFPINLTFSGMDGTVLMTGLIIIIISWVMHRAQLLHEETLFTI